MTVNDVMREIRELDKTLPAIGVSGDAWEDAIQRQCDTVSKYEAALRNLGCGPRDGETDQMFADRASDTARAALIR